MAKDINNDIEEIEVEGLEEVNASEEFVEKNFKTIAMVVGGVLLAVIAGIYFYSTSGSSELADQKKIFRAQYYFGLDSTNAALFGSETLNEDLVGFDELTNELESSKVKNLNNYYVGLLNLKNGEYQQAVDYLSDFDSDDELLLARGKSLLGDAYMELAETEASNYSKAITAYKKASTLKENTAFTPIYLMKLALAYELNKDNENAIATYNKIITGYKPTVTEVNDAKKYKAVLEAKTKKS